MQIDTQILLYSYEFCKYYEYVGYWISTVNILKTEDYYTQ